MKLEWRKNISKTSMVQYAGKNSYYDFYTVLVDGNIYTSYDCKFIWDNNAKEFKLIVIKTVQIGWGNSEPLSKEVIKEYAHELENMKIAKKFVESLI